jgi:hypothetical protein
VTSIAVGGSVLPAASSGWDFAPLIGTVIALLALVVGLRLRASWPVFVSAFALGVLWAALIGTWGLITPTGLAFLAFVGARSVRRRTRSP